jgi:hypothetical protein
MQEIARILDETWALIKDQPDAIKLYGSNPSKGKEFNSLFRKTLSRKFNEVTASPNSCASARACTTTSLKFLEFPPGSCL